MANETFFSHLIEERSYVAYVKREIHKSVSERKFSPRQVGEIDIIVSELCSNLIKHANGGELLYRCFDVDDSISTLELICIDKGPGIYDLPRVMKDGVSTTNTLGHGLGSIERLSSHFQIYSQPGWGTIVFSTVTSSTQPFHKKTGVDLDIRALCVSKPRETVCGDGYRIKRTESEIKILFADGLGHGEHAHAAVAQAGNFFFESEETDPVDIIRQLHDKVRRTRGLVASVAVLDKKTNTWAICGVGNILTRMYSGIVYKNYMAYNGTLGLNIPTSMKSSLYPVERNQYLFMSSDGIRTRWEMTRYPSILKHDPMVMCAALYKDHNRGTDDSSVLIAKVI